MVKVVVPEKKKDVDKYPNFTSHLKLKAKGTMSLGRRGATGMKSRCTSYMHVSICCCISKPVTRL